MCTYSSADSLVRHVRHCSLIAALAAASGWTACVCQAADEVATSRPSSRPSATEIVITIVYDNNPGRKDLTAAWGFACVIQGLEKTILFDTGGNGKILLENMRRLHLDPGAIDAVVLSHVHGDHTGGLASFAKVRSNVPVYLPTGFPAAFKKQARSLGLEPQEAADSHVVCPGAQTTGTLGRGAIEEQGLCVKTRQGWILITGCAHPGVANMAAQGKKVTGGPIHLVMGGFHLLRHSASQIDKVIDRFVELGVQRVGPCHCTGDPARDAFKRRFGTRCTLAGVGSAFRFPRDEADPKSKGRND